MVAENRSRRRAGFSKWRKPSCWNSEVRAHARQRLRILTLDEIHKLLAYLAAQIEVAPRVDRAHEDSQLHSALTAVGNLYDAHAAVPVRRRLAKPLYLGANRLHR